MTVYEFGLRRVSIKFGSSLTSFGPWLLLVVAAAWCTAAAHAQETAPESYILGEGDEVRIDVYGEPDLSLDARVDSGGHISYPFLGGIRLRGRTVTEVERIITSGLEGDYLVSPDVNVRVTSFRNFFVNGEVQKPGGYPYTPGLNVFEAISIAGGFTERASKNKLYLIRDDDPRQERKLVDTKTRVGPGDTLTVEQSFW